MYAHLVLFVAKRTYTFIFKINKRKKPTHKILVRSLQAAFVRAAFLARQEPSLLDNALIALSSNEGPSLAEHSLFENK